MVEPTPLKNILVKLGSSSPIFRGENLQKYLNFRHLRWYLEDADFPFCLDAYFWGSMFKNSRGDLPPTSSVFPVEGFQGIEAEVIFGNLCCKCYSTWNKIIETHINSYRISSNISIWKTRAPTQQLIERTPRYSECMDDLPTYFQVNRKIWMAYRAEGSRIPAAYGNFWVDTPLKANMAT